MLAVFINIIDNMKTDKKFTFTVTQLLRTSKTKKTLGHGDGCCYWSYKHYLKLTKPDSIRNIRKTVTVDLSKASQTSVF